MIGSAATSFGLSTLLLHLTRPQLFSKLAAMKERWGNAAGLTLHIIAYSLLPLLFGLLSLWAGVRGVSLF